MSEKLMTDEQQDYFIYDVAFTSDLAASLKDVAQAADKFAKALRRKWKKGLSAGWFVPIATTWEKAD